MAPMVKKTGDENRFYYIQCGDWDGVSMAKTPREASMDIISQSNNCFKENLKNSEVMIVMDVKDEMESVHTNNVSAFSLDSLISHES